MFSRFLGKTHTPDPSIEAPDTRAPYCEPANRQRTERQRTQRESAEGQRTGGESMLLRDCEAHAPRQAGYVPLRKDRGLTPGYR